jgi:hypothetical protein
MSCAFIYALYLNFNALAMFQNLNLAHHFEVGSLEFVDVLPEVQPTPDRRESLRILIERVEVCLDRAAGCPALIILDDISTLDWIGFPLLELSRFLRALRATCLKVRTFEFSRYIV